MDNFCHTQMTKSQQQAAITILANLCEINGLEYVRQWLCLHYIEDAVDKALEEFRDDDP